MIRAVLSASLCLAIAGPAFAINKCTGADGKTVFQDAPCMGKGETITVKPASGQAPAPVIATPAAAASGAAPAAASPAPAATAKKEGAFGEKWRRKTDLESHLISNARGELSSHMQSCQQQQSALAAKKGGARNNLAGATWEASISAEMQAAATMCDTKARDIRAKLEGYERELRELQAAK
jgi:hypothetical protein